MKNLINIFFTLTLLTTACSKTEQKPTDQVAAMEKKAVELTGNEEVATLAGGGFWCMEAPF